MLALSSSFHDFTVLTGSKSLYCTLSDVDIIISLLKFLINTSRKHYVCRSTTSARLPFHRNCRLRSLLAGTAQKIRGSTRSLLRTLCTAFSFALLAGSKGLGEQRLIKKSFAGCFLLPAEGTQSSFTSVLTIQA